MIYLFLLIILLVGVLKYELQPFSFYNKIQHNKYLFASFLILAIVAGLAYDLGVDTVRYVDNYRSWIPLKELTWKHFDGNYSRYQPGFIVIFSFFKSITGNYLLYQIVHAIFYCYVICRFAKRYSPNPIFVILLFYIVNYLEFSFEIQRESTAVCFSLLAFEQFDNKNYKWGSLWCIAAFLCHVSAIICVLMILMGRIKQTNLGVWIILLLCTFSSILFAFFPYFGLILSYFDTTDELFEQVYELDQAGDLNLNGIIAQFLKYLLIPAGAIIWGDKEKNKYLYLALLFAAFRIISYYSYGLYRFSNYFAIFYFIVCVDFLNKLVINNSSKNHFFKFFLTLATVAYFLIVFQSKLLKFEEKNNAYYYERYFPYQSVLDHNNSYE